MNEKMFNYCLANIRRKRCFDKLYDYFYRRIVIHIIRKFGYQTHCEDIAQETFLKILQLKEYKYIEHYTSWIYKISENIAYTKLGKNASVQNSVFYQQKIPFEDRIIEPFGALQEIVEKQDATSKQILYLHYIEGYTFNEIADMIGIRNDSVRQIHYRCLKKLKILYNVSQKVLLNLFI